MAAIQKQIENDVWNNQMNIITTIFTQQCNIFMKILSLDS